MLLSDRRRSISPVISTSHSERRRSDPCPVEAENPNENWEPSSELKDVRRDIAEQAAEDDLRDSNLLSDALEIDAETKRPDE